MKLLVSIIRLLSPMLNIQIGPKLKTTSILIIAIILASCKEKIYDYYYDINLYNNTYDTLYIVLGYESRSYPIDSFFIYPLMEKTFYSTAVDKQDNNIKEIIFSHGYLGFQEQLRAYRNDTLIINWLGPGEDMGDSIHSFFNYSSWDIWLIDDKNGIARFTINETDFGHIEK